MFNRTFAFVAQHQLGTQKHNNNYIPWFSKSDKTQGSKNFSSTPSLLAEQDKPLLHGSPIFFLNKKKKKKRLSKEERSKIYIQSPLDEIIIGLLLGDGHLQRRHTNSRFIFAQSSLREHHLSYFWHVYSLFSPFLSKEFQAKPRTFLDKRTNKTYGSIAFATLTLPCFNKYKDLFYNYNKKIVPNNISQLLTPVGLAY